MKVHVVTAAVVAPADPAVKNWGAAKWNDSWHIQLKGPLSVKRDLSSSVIPAVEIGNSTSAAKYPCIRPGDRSAIGASY